MKPIDAKQFIVINANTGEALGGSNTRREAIESAKKCAESSVGITYAVYERDCTVWAAVKVFDDLPKAGEGP